jgi:hypothetical protein
MYPNDPTSEENFGANPQLIVPQQNPADGFGVVPPLPTPAATVPHAGHNPYEFMITPKDKPKASLFKGAKSSASRLLLIVLGAGLVVVILAIVISALLPKNSSVQSLTAIAQEQQEIMRVASQGERQATSETTKGIAYTVDLSIGTSQTKLLNYLSTRNTKLSTKQLDLKKDANTDTMLEAAQASSSYDSALKKQLAEQLKTYLTDVQQTYKSASNAQLKQILDSSYSAGKVLLGEVKTIQN